MNEVIPVGPLAEEANQKVECDSAPLQHSDEYEIAISTFTNKFASIAKTIRLTVLLFLALFGKHEVRQQKEGKMFAPAVFNGSRSNDNFISASALCMDFDHGQPRVEQVLDLFPATLVVFYSTFSHCFRSTEKNRDGLKVPADLTYTRENPRFRVVIPFSRPIDAREHALLVAGVRSLIPDDLMDCLDTTCFEKSRSHYLPSCPPELASYAFSGVQDGELLNVERFIAHGSELEMSVLNKPAKKKPSKTESAVPLSNAADSTDISELATWAARNPDFDFVSALDIRYRRGEIRNGKQHIMCPFESDHTDQSPDFATFIANASPPEHNSWDIHCCHAHCVERDRLEFIAEMLKLNWISLDISAMPLRRPPKIYYPTNDILAAPDWCALVADERRIALDLMTIAWSSDGTIIDDDWQISRRLGLNENEWLGYRNTLTRTGWLMQADGKLINSIVQREFEKAQVAYMTAISRASTGGKSTQLKARADKQRK